MRDTFVDLCPTLREPPADIRLELGDDGDILLARIRLLFATLPILLPVINYYVGGEEFVLILHRPIGAAWERVEMLRRKLEGCRFLPAEGVAPRVMTFSAGIAASPDDAENVSGLMRTADLRLRAAKLAGRNRIVARDSR